MKLVTVGLGGSHVSQSPEDLLITYALGSCVAVVIHDPETSVGGMLHLVLPRSGIDPMKARRNPFHFADTGIPRLVRRATELGAAPHRLVVVMAGGSQIVDPDGKFGIGTENCIAVRQVIAKIGLALRAEDIGGRASRTVCLEIGTGRTLTRSMS
jgi:chemotaxis protein CheD